MAFHLVVVVDGTLFGTDLFGRVWERRMEAGRVEWIIYTRDVRVLR